MHCFLFRRVFFPFYIPISVFFFFFFLGFQQDSLHFPSPFRDVTKNLGNLLPSFVLGWWFNFPTFFPSSKSQNFPHLAWRANPSIEPGLPLFSHKTRFALHSRDMHIKNKIFKNHGKGAGGIWKVFCFLLFPFATKKILTTISLIFFFLTLFLLFLIFHSSHMERVRLVCHKSGGVVQIWSFLTSIPFQFFKYVR